MLTTGAAATTAAPITATAAGGGDAGDFWAPPAMQFSADVGGRRILVTTDCGEKHTIVCLLELSSTTACVASIVFGRPDAGCQVFEATVRQRRLLFAEALTRPPDGGLPE